MTRDEAEAVLRAAVAHRVGADEYVTTIVTAERDGAWWATVEGDDGDAAGSGATEDAALRQLLRGLCDHARSGASVNAELAARKRAEADDLDARAAEERESARVLREALR